ncbi:hypothetical protein LguiB_007552 [Lonicera macranthoides]
MDPPPIAAVTTTAAALNNPPDATNSSPPHCRQTDTWDHQSLPPVPGAKMRLMCSYGGHIIPRPHDKSLCYVGGDTRMVVVDRHSSLSDLTSRLSRTLFHGRDFTLKYQLPNEDLDSLVSVTTEEDLENMIEEFDRSDSVSLKPSRLRLFLFLSKPETATSMGSLLDDSKSETWFVDALNSAAFLPRGLSDSAANEHIELERINNSNSSNDLEAQNESRQVQSITTSDSPFVETNSSFGSSSSSPIMSNLPPIRVRVDEGGTGTGTGTGLMDQMVGLDEQLSQMSFVTTEQKVDEGFVRLSVPPPLPVVNCGTGGPVNRVGSSENLGRVFSDDERLDQGAPSGFRKPPLPLQPVQRKMGHDGYSLPSPDSKYAGGYNLPSPDSVTSDTSITSANSLSKHSYYQDAAPNTTRPPTGLISPTTNNNNTDPTSEIQIQQQVQDPSLCMPPPQQNQQQQQQQYFHTSTTPYMHHPGTAQVPMSPYYQMYVPPPQQQQPYHQQVDQQYQMYLMPVAQTQPYNMTMQSSAPDGQQINPQNPAIVSSSNTYQTNQPEMAAASVYRTAATTTPTMVSVSNQFQHQYVNLSNQMVHPPQTSAGGGGGNYGYEYTHPTNEQVYYTQHSVAPVAPQYQTMSPATAVLLSQASAQQAANNTKQQMG